MDDEPEDVQVEAGAVARARAMECGIPDWHQVVRVRFDPLGAKFFYDDCRKVGILGLQP